MKRHNSLFPKIISTDNLLLAYQKASKGKHWQSTVKQFESNINFNVSKIQDSLINKTFNTSNYTEMTIHEPKTRIIYKLPFNPDRIVQHALMNIVELIWDKLFIYNSYACRAKKGIHAGSQKTMQFIREVGSNSYCLKMDISKFYPSINHDILFNIINHKIKCKDTLWLLHNIIYSFPGYTNVPIGNYTSQWFGNLYLNELDQWLKHFHKIEHYIRYCDDFLILHPNKTFLHELSLQIKEHLFINLNLKLSKCNLFPIKLGIDFLGYRHFPNYILLRKSTSKRIKKRLKLLPLLLKKNKVSFEHYRSSLASTLGWLKWANTHNFRQSTGIDNLWKEISLAK